MWFVGEGPMRASLERAAPDGTVFFGRVPEAEKRDLMRRSHALVVTSVREGWGLVVSEAAQQGLRSVAYDVPGLRDSVPAADGLLTLPTPAALASALVGEWSDRAHLTWTPPLDIGTKPWADVADEVLGAIGAAITSGPSAGAGR
jgi:glycosyltransferase involved in cell wall biosynthesis